jgi:hypothetical protein
MLQYAGRQTHFEVLHKDNMGGLAEIDTAHGSRRREPVNYSAAQLWELRLLCINPSFPPHFNTST